MSYYNYSESDDDVLVGCYNKKCKHHHKVCESICAIKINNGRITINSHGKCREFLSQ